MSWQNDDGTQSQVFGPVIVPIANDTFQPKLPTNPPAAKAGLLVAAMPFFFMSLGTELDPQPEQMDWLPVYADTVDRVQTHPSQAPFYFAELTETLPTPFDPSASAGWTAIYDDNLPHWDRRIGMIPMGRIEGALGAPLRNGADFYGPDFVLPLARGPHAALAPFFFFDPEPIVPPVFDPAVFPWPGAEYPDRLAPKPYLPMGQAHGTLKKVSTVPPAVYPDTIEPPRGLHASQQRAFFMDLEPIAPVFDTTTVPRTSFPNQLPQWTPQAHASQAPYFFYEGNPSDVDPQAEEMGWQPELPDFARGRSTHPSAMPSVFWDPRPVDPTTEFAWRPTYPDRIDRLQPHPSQMPSVFFEGDPRNFGFELGSWYPVYPDAVDRVEIHASQHPFFSGNLDPKVFPEVLGSWYPTYPDLIDPTAGLHASQQRPFFFNPDPIPTPDIPIPQQNIRPVYPDTIDRRPSMHAAPYFFFVEEPTDLPPEAEEMGWQPSYPDQIARLTTHPSDMPSVFAVYDPDDFPVPVLSWEPELPTQVSRVEAHASLMPSVFLTLVPDDLSWEPEYPDQVAHRPGREQSPFYFAPEREPAAAFDPADLSWTPSYPDAVARATVYPADAPTVFLNLAPENFTPPLGSWYGSYPDFATAQTRPHASTVPAFFMDPQPITGAVVPLASTWYPSYPVILPRIIPTQPVYVFEPGFFPNPTRITQMPIEVPQIDDTISTRITQMPMEVAQVDDTIATRATQVAIEIVHTGDCPTFTPSVPPPVGNPPPCPPVGPTVVASHDCPPVGTK